jgi:enoyl-CoA hydratase
LIADMYYANVLPQQIGPARARDLLLTGRRLSAQEAEAWGIVSRIVPHDRLLDEAVAVLESCRQAAPQCCTAVKRGINSVYGRYDRMTMDLSLAGDESQEGYRSFKERRAPAWVRSD